jgi:hypothetical protein
MNTYSDNITKLKDNEVFIFGSNLRGFHGAGSAGFASFNEVGNVWRKHGYDKWPDGKKGAWNIKGVGWGYQEGEIGKSYAIPTVINAGAKRSFPLEHIRKHIEAFNHFSKGMNHLHFYVAQGAGNNLNGYSIEELRKIWFNNIEWDYNVFFNNEFAGT